MSLPGGYVFPDLSNHVNATNASAFVAAYPVAACKVSEGSGYADWYWPIFKKMMLDAGCTPIGYHFLRAETSVASQVTMYLQNAGNLTGVGIMLDTESSANGSNPSMDQASAWLSEISRQTGRPRSTMLHYLPRWWWQAHGGGSIATADTMLHQSDYNSTPSLVPFAGYQRIHVLQFSSTYIGAGMPAGDMNIAVGMAAGDLKIRLGLTPDPGVVEVDMGLSQDDKDWLWNNIVAGSQGHPGMPGYAKQGTDATAALSARVDKASAAATLASGALSGKIDLIASMISVTPAALRDAIARATAEDTPEPPVQDVTPRHPGTRSEPNAL